MVLVVVLICVATYRLTRLLVVDAFRPLAALRDRIERRYGTESSVTYLANCPWCVGLWMAAGTVAVVDLATDQPVVLPVLVALTASAVTGLVAAIEPE